MIDATPRDFLLEIGTEEMPSAPLTAAAAQLEKNVLNMLDAAGLAHGEARVRSTPRRLAVIVQDVAGATEEIHEALRGPSAAIAFTEEGTPTKAALGFARKNGICADDLMCRADTDGRDYVFVEKHLPAQDALPLLSKLAHELIASLEWPNYRSQRWGSEQESFVRPVRWICCLFGCDIVPVRYADVHSTNTTRGHRVLAPGEHVVAHPKTYEATLRDAYVLFQDERCARIRQGIAELEHQLHIHVDTPSRIFDEVVNLCEWPTVLQGTFDEEFLAVPQEIICESMLSNQRYFPTFDEQGHLTRTFVVVSNADPRVSHTVIDGNERVVRARLFDAKFFYDEDLKVSLEDFRDRLAHVAFQQKLGSMLQKSKRIEALAGTTATLCNFDPSMKTRCMRAAHLAKADLVSQAVVEFTSQQGVMGGYYALAQGETQEVADAIREHYRPRFAGDELPGSEIGCVVALADKLDTIAGMFAIDEPPTGSKDPYAQRRAAIGLINILRLRLHIGYNELIDAALDAYAAQGLQFDAPRVAEAVRAFLLGRMQQMARDEGLSPDTISAISAGEITAPTDFFALATALEHARAHDRETFENLGVAYRRAAHLSDPSLGIEVDSSLLIPAEHALLTAIDTAQHTCEQHLVSHDFDGLISELANMRVPIDTFFDEVMVMDDAQVLRENRLRLLNRFVAVFAYVADIGELAH